jgi:hypothetical protein
LGRETKREATADAVAEEERDSPPREADDEDYDEAPLQRGAGQQASVETTRTRTPPPAGCCWLQDF